jgi:hypothetical protein
VLCCVVVAVVINAAKQSNVMRCSAMGCGAMECNQYACLGRIKEHLHFVVLCCVVLCWIGLGCGEADDHLIVGGLLPTPLIVDHYGITALRRCLRKTREPIVSAWTCVYTIGMEPQDRHGVLESRQAGRGGGGGCAMVCYGVLWCAMVCYGVLWCAVHAPCSTPKPQISSLKPQTSNQTTGGKGLCAPAAASGPRGSKTSGCVGMDEWVGWVDLVYLPDHTPHPTSHIPLPI